MILTMTFPYVLFKLEMFVNFQIDFREIFIVVLSFLICS